MKFCTDATRGALSLFPTIKIPPILPRFKGEAKRSGSLTSHVSK